MEVGHTHGTVDDGDDNENDGDDGEECQGLLSWLVFLPIVRLVYPDKLEKEVCQGSKVEKLELLAENHQYRVCWEQHTRMIIIPTVLSRRTNTAAQMRIKMVTGIAARVSANSISCLPVTMTTN